MSLALQTRLSVHLSASPMARAEGNGVSLSSSAHGSPLICSGKKSTPSASGYLLSGAAAQRAACCPHTRKQKKKPFAVITGSVSGASVSVHGHERWVKFGSERGERGERGRREPAGGERLARVVDGGAVIGSTGRLRSLSLSHRFILTRPISEALIEFRLN